MSEERTIKDNFFDSATWLRGLFMLLFVVIYSVAEIIVAAVVVLQWLFTLFTGSGNQQLRTFGQSLSTFVYQIMRYWTFNSDEKPFPFSDWPAGDGA